MLYEFSDDVIVVASAEAIKAVFGGTSGNRVYHKKVVVREVAKDATEKEREAALAAAVAAAKTL